MKKTALTHLSRLPSCLAIAALASTNFLSLSVQAQETADEEEVRLEEIVVTGSRLVRTGFETPSPVVMIGADEIGAETSPALGDLLNDLPQLRTTFGLGNSSRFIGTAGIGLLDLRGLGDERTLVLVNGRRHVSSSEGAQGVDVNSIPTDMIDRIEIITGANSAVYGADAVAGVVNFILKDDFEGVTLRASTGEADDSSFGRNSFAFTVGKNFDEGRGNAVFSVGVENQDLLLASDRGGDFTRNWGFVTNPDDGDTIDANGIQIDDGIPDEILVPNQGFWAISNAGVSLALGGLLNPDGSFSPVPFGDFEYTDGLQCGGMGCTALDLSGFVPLQAEFSRTTLDANFRYTLNDEMEWYFEGRYANVDAKQQGQPSFDFGAPVIIARDNAFVTPSLGAAMDAAGAGAIDLRRFNIDLGNRRENNIRETFRGVTGLKGTIGNSDYSYDVFANYGRSTIERINLNNRIDERWAAAQDAVQIDAAGALALQGSGLAPNASAGDIVCRATLTEALNATDPVANPDDSGLPNWAYEGCVPANVIGFGLISQEAKDWINSTALSTAKIQQAQFAAVISNPALVEHWAGEIGGVVGLEYRREQSEVVGDSLSALGNTFFNALADTTGEFDVTEVFAEFAVPLLVDMPAAEDLTLEVAGRYSDYDSIGNTFTWETRLNWQPIETLRFRINVGEALRAPTIGDLFSPAGEDFTNIDDPCDMENLDLGAAGRNTRIANCQALGIADPENFDSLDEESITELQGGNPNLEEEQAETMTIGFVYSPNWADNLQFSVDWYDIEITDAISFTTPQTILDRCVDDPNGIDNQFCALVTRDGVGNITQLRSFPLNLNEFKTNGLDFEVDYGIDIGAGTLQNRLVASYLEERIQILRSSDNFDLLHGELGDPELQINYRGEYAVDNWSAFIELRWIDEMYTEEQELLFGSSINEDPNPDVNDRTVTDAYLYADIGATYAFENGLEITAIIDNVTGEDPPKEFLGTGGLSGIFDNIGRFYSVRAVYNFGE